MNTNLRNAALTGIAALCISAAPIVAQQTDPTTGAGSTTGTATPNGAGSNNGASSGSSVGSSTAMGTGMSASGTSSDSAAQDKMFLAKSAEGGMTEITFSQLALKRSKNDEVKTYAQKMVDDHTKLIADMKPFAEQMGVQPPTKLKPEHQQELARLRAKTGDAFDKEYITAMVADHHKDVGEFQEEINKTSNPDLKSTVTRGLQVVKMHTEMIDTIAQKNNIATPPMPSPAM